MTIRKPCGLEGQLTVWARFLVLCSPLPGTQARAPGEGAYPRGLGAGLPEHPRPGPPPRSAQAETARLHFAAAQAALPSSRIRLRSRQGPGPEPLSQGSRGKERLEVRAARGERAAEAEGSGQRMRGQFNPLGK